MLLASGSGDNTAKVWDSLTGKELHTLPGSQGGVTSVAFDPRPGSRRLVVGSTDGIVRMFLLEIDDLTALAHTRVTRSLLPWECQKFLHQEACSPR
jgi:WD40 repeat protein